MEEVLFGDPFQNHESNYLTPVDLYNLCQTCKQYKKTITKQYFEKATIKEIRRRLLYLYKTKTNLYNFLTNLKKGVISGSFIIECILDNYCDEIDCYYPNTVHFNKEVSRFKMNDYFSKYYLDQIVLSSFDTTMRHMILKTNNVHLFIDSEFDFDICKNRYWYTNKDQLYVKSFNQILSKKAVSPYNIKTPNHRELKYINKGFTFIKK